QPVQYARVGQSPVDRRGSGRSLRVLVVDGEYDTVPIGVPGRHVTAHDVHGHRLEVVQGSARHRQDVVGNEVGCHDRRTAGAALAVDPLQQRSELLGRAGVDHELVVGQHGGDLVLATAARTADPAAVCELADAVAEVGAQDRNEVQPAPDALRPLDDTAGEALHLVPER